MIPALGISGTLTSTVGISGILTGETSGVFASINLTGAAIYFILVCYCLTCFYGRRALFSFLLSFNGDWLTTGAIGYLISGSFNFGADMLGIAILPIIGTWYFYISIDCYFTYGALGVLRDGAYGVSIFGIVGAETVGTFCA